MNRRNFFTKLFGLAVVVAVAKQIVPPAPPKYFMGIDPGKVGTKGWTTYTFCFKPMTMDEIRKSLADYKSKNGGESMLIWQDVFRISQS